MKNGIHQQIKIAFSSNSLILTIIFGILYSISFFIYNCIINFKNDYVSVPSADSIFLFNSLNQVPTLIFGIILPLMACMAFSDSYVVDNDYNYLSLCLPRMRIKEYFYSKLFTVFICGFIVALIPQILNYLLCIFTFPLKSTNTYNWDLWQSYLFEDIIVQPFFFFKKLYIFSPYLYFLSYIFISSFISSLFSVIAFQLSFIVKNRIFSITFVFVFINLLGYLFDKFMLPFDVRDYIFGFSVGNQTVYCFIITITFYHKQKKKKKK